MTESIPLATACAEQLIRDSVIEKKGNYKDKTNACSRIVARAYLEALAEIKRLRAAYDAAVKEKL